jgi:RNA polymerase sigma-70 factor (ECF subfamily)
MDALRKEFEDTALPYMDEIHRAALRMTKNKSEADDLVQDTFLRAFRFFKGFEKGTSIKAWLHKILRNTFINRFNEQAKKPEHVEFGQIKFFEDEPVSGNDPEQDIIYKVFDDELRQAISALPNEFKIVIMLSDIEGFSYKEIADITQCPIGTVMSRLHRGRKLLRSSLRKHADDMGLVHEC